MRRLVLAALSLLALTALAHAQAQGPQDPCFSTKKTNVAISTATGTTVLVTGVASQRIFICSFMLVVPSAVSVNLAEGTGPACNTASQAAVIGVSESGTASNGMALPANGGVAIASNASIAQTATAGNSLCLFQSGTAQVAGNLTYVQTQQ